MKKIFMYITVIYATISMASNSVDVKFATNVGVGLEGGSYYNLYGSSNYSKEKGQQAIFAKKTVFTGSFEAKILKSFNIKKDLKIKVGAGASIDITKLPILNKFVAVIKNGEKITKVKNNGDYNISLPHTGDWGVGLGSPFQEKTKGFEWGFGAGEIDDAKTQMPKLIDLSKKTVYTSLTAFGTVEIEKMLKNFSVYFGLDAGLDIVLEKIEEKVTYSNKSTQEYFIYLLERRKSIVRPKVKGYTGINYKGFETEIGLGYPQFVTLGVGYRFNL